MKQEIGSWISFFFKKRFDLFIERGREGEKEGENHRCVVASHIPSTGDLACNPGLCPEWEWNQQPFGSQAGGPSTELDQPGLFFFFFLVYLLYFFPLSFTPLIALSPLQSPHCCPCPWVLFPSTPPPVVIIILSMSLSVFCLLVQFVHQIPHMSESYGICISLTGLFHLV